MSPHEHHHEPVPDTHRRPLKSPAPEPHRSQHHDHASMMADPAMAAEMEADMRRRFFLALVLTIPITIIAGHIPGLPMVVHPPLSSWLGLVLSTPVVFWSGSIFLSGSVSALRSRKLDMSVLIATGVLAAYLSSVYLTLIGYPTAYYEAAAMLVTFVLFGHWMEIKARRGTSDSLRALFDLVPPRARVIRDGSEVEVPTSEVKVGDILSVRPGEKIPVDGEIVEGETEVDEALVTGESNPVHRKPGDPVIGAALNVSGAVMMRATKVGRDTVLAQIAALVAEAQNSKAPGQRLADKAAAVLVIVAVGAGILTFVGWKVFAGAPFLTALTFAISAVVVACPDALGLATPTAVAVGTGLGAKNHILIKDAATLEGASRLQIVVLDKTGTLTEGKPTVTDVRPADDTGPEILLQHAAAVSASSTHPLSQAVVRAANERSLQISHAADAKNIPGAGVAATIDGKTAIVGNAKMLENSGIELGPAKTIGEELARNGRSLVYVAAEGKVLGVLGITDRVRPSSAQAIAKLKELGVEPILMSGDNKQTAERVAREVGIDRVYSQVRPEDKVRYVKELQSQRKIVGMVGDGINDAPALAQSDIGIAIGSGTDVAVQAAKIVLMRSDPVDVPRAIRLSNATVRKMKQNLAWASVYNLLAIPVAAGVFYKPLGWSLRPEVSALLMSLSSIIVALNAVSLRRAKI